MKINFKMKESSAELESSLEFSVDNWNYTDFIDKAKQVLGNDKRINYSFTKGGFGIRMSEDTVISVMCSRLEGYLVYVFNKDFLEHAQKLVNSYNLVFGRKVFLLNDYS